MTGMVGLSLADKCAALQAGDFCYLTGACGSCHPFKDFLSLHSL